MATTQDTPSGQYRGYDIFFNKISYNCPELKLYGYGLDALLYAAIRRKLKAGEAKRQARASKV